MKIPFLFVVYIICAIALDVAFGRPDTSLNPIERPDTSINPIERPDTALNPIEHAETNGTADSNREKRGNKGSCGWSGGCLRGYCWAYCTGILGAGRYICYKSI